METMYKVEFSEKLQLFHFNETDEPTPNGWKEVGKSETYDEAMLLAVVVNQTTIRPITLERISEVKIKLETFLNLLR